MSRKESFGPIDPDPQQSVSREFKSASISRSPVPTPVSKVNLDLEGWYMMPVLVVGLVTFGAIWLYAIDSWGVLIGLALGWIPALVGGLLAGYGWPLVAIGLALVYL